jgi:predicted  nucleic acid-binding Zn-ribbon protein
MPDENHNFFQLQEYDLTIFSIEDKLSSISKKFEEKLGIEELKEKLLLIEMKFKELLKLQIRVSQMIDQSGNNINELNITLYSGKIKNTKEVEAIELEIKNNTESLSSYESKKNQVDENISKLNEIKENYELKIISLEEKWIESEENYKFEIKQLNNNKIHLEEKRKTLSKNLDKKILNLYDSFISRNRNKGISKLENRISTCCKIELPNAFVEKIKANELPIVCNCGKSLISE